MKKIGKHRLIERITSAAIIESMYSCRASTGEKHRPLKEGDLPGRMIMRLTQEEREALKKCTSKDFSWRGFKDGR